jgi:hypothetical protein
VSAWTVIFAPAAEDQIASLYEYIADERGLPQTAARYVGAIITDCGRARTRRSSLSDQSLK